MTLLPESTDTLSSPSHSMLHRPYLNAKAYGATGDGLTDDTAALQDCIDAASDAEGHVFIPGGNYKLTSSLTLDGARAVRISGAGGTNPNVGGGGYTSGTRLAGTINAPLISRTSVDDANGTIVIEDIGLNNFHATGSCISLTGMTSPGGVYRCWMVGHIGIGAMTGFGQTIASCKFQKGSTTLAGSIGIVLTGHTVVNNIDMNGFSKGISVTGAAIESDMFGGRIEVCETGIHVGTDGQVANGGVISGYYFEACDISIDLDHTASFLVSGCKFHGSGNAPSGSSDVAVTTNRTYATSVMNCTTSGTFSIAPFQIESNGSRDNLIFVGARSDAAWSIADTRGITISNCYPQADITRVPVVATASLPVAATAENGRIIIEDAGTGNRNLILYAGGERFRIDGGANV